MYKQSNTPYSAAAITLELWWALHISPICNSGASDHLGGRFFLVEPVEISWGPPFHSHAFQPNPKFPKLSRQIQGSINRTKRILHLSQNLFESVIRINFAWFLDFLFSFNFGLIFYSDFSEDIIIPFHNPQRRCTSCVLLCICEVDQIPNCLPLWGKCCVVSVRSVRLGVIVEVFQW